jgi:hypothetical protein
MNTETIQEAANRIYAHHRETGKFPRRAHTRTMEMLVRAFSSDAIRAQNAEGAASAWDEATKAQERYGD